MRELNEIILHCSDTYADMDIGFDEINQWHLDRGWSGCGYHMIIRRDGTVEAGRPLERIGAHCRGKNSRSIGLVLVGGKPGFNFTKAQMETLEIEIRDIRALIPGIEVSGHNEYSSKTCPTFDVKAYFNGPALSQQT